MILASCSSSPQVDAQFRPVPSVWSSRACQSWRLTIMCGSSGTLTEEAGFAMGKGGDPALVALDRGVFVPARLAAPSQVPFQRQAPQPNQRGFQWLVAEREGPVSDRDEDPGPQVLEGVDRVQRRQVLVAKTGWF